MAWLDPRDAFDPDTFQAPVVGIAASMVDHDSGVHRHGRGQLLYARRGSIRITLAQQLCLLPPTRAAWIPPGVEHRAVMRQIADYRSLYFSPALSATLPSGIRVIDIGPLLHVVLESMVQAGFDQDWTRGRHAHLLGLCLEEIRLAPCRPMLLPLPRDRRLAGLCARPDVLPPALGVLERQVGASGKTISRIFSRETGMGYQQWRQQWRLMRAIELMAAGHGLSHTAGALGFASDSAFILFFKQRAGCTPKAFFK